MTKKQYSNSDVEKLLTEIAKQDRRQMEDASMERFLSLIRGETERHAPVLLYARALQWAAVLVLLLACLPVLYIAFSHDSADNTVVAVQEVPETPLAGQPPVAAAGTTECAPEVTPAMGETPSIARAAGDNRAFLNHIDNTLNAGFAPAPQETYEGRSGRRYGASVYGRYEITACTDTLQPDMKKTLIALLLWLPLALHANDAPQYGPGPHSPDGVCWEIVSDIYIGVQTERLTPEERAASTNEWLQLKGACMCGLRVKRVIPDSPAEKGGLKVGDIILLNCACPIASMEDLLLSVRNMRPGDMVHFAILRNGEQMPLSFRIGGLPQPVVVAHARLLQEGENQPKWHPGAGPHDEDPRDKGLTPNAAMSAKQTRIAALLAAEVPDLKTIREEVRNLNALFPDFGRIGQIRLYYETDFGYVTVTCFQEGVMVTIQSGLELQAYQLKKQGDTLPEPLRKIFSEL